MTKDIWKFMFVMAHFGVIFAGGVILPDIGGIVAIGLIILLWWAKIKYVPNIDLWPDKTDRDSDWPKSVKSDVRIIGQAIGYIMTFAFFAGLVMSVGRCSPADFGRGSNSFDPARP